MTGKMSAPPWHPGEQRMSHGRRGVKLMNFKTLEHVSEGAEIYSMLWQHNRRPILVCRCKSITKLDCYRMDFRTCPFSTF